VTSRQPFPAISPLRIRARARVVKVERPSGRLVASFARAGSRATRSRHGRALGIAVCIGADCARGISAVSAGNGQPRRCHRRLGPDASPRRRVATHRMMRSTAPFILSGTVRAIYIYHSTTQPLSEGPV